MPTKQLAPACFYIGLICTFVPYRVHAQPPSDIRTQKQVIMELDSAVNDFTGSPTPLTNEAAGSISRSLHTLATKSAQIAKNSSATSHIVLLGAEVSWYGQQTPKVRAAYSRMVRKAIEDVNALREDRNPGSERHANVVTSIEDIRGLYPRSFVAVKCFYLATRYYFHHFRKTGDVIQAIEAEIEFRNLNFGDLPSLTIPCYAQMLQAKYEKGEVTDVLAEMPILIATLAENDLIASFEAWNCIASLANQAGARSDVVVLNACRKSLHALALHHDKFPELKDTITSLDQLAAILEGDFEYMIEQGKSISPATVSTASGCACFLNYALAMCECGEFARIEPALQTALTRLRMQNSRTRHSFGYTFAKFLAYEERWEAAADVLSPVIKETERDLAQEDKLVEAIKCLQMWIDVNHAKQVPTIDEVNALRADVTRFGPTPSPLTRSLDLTEAVLSLRMGDIDRANSLIAKVRTFDEMKGKDRKSAGSLQRLKVEMQIAKAKMLTAVYEKCAKEIAEIEKARVVRRKLIAKELDLDSSNR